MKKLIALSLTCIMSIMLIIPVLAVSPGDTTVNFDAGVSFYYTVTTPTEITIDGDGGDVTIKGVSGGTVTVTAPDTIEVSNDNNTDLKTEAKINFDGVSLPTSMTEEKSDTETITATFESGKKPLVKGTYTGTIIYTIDEGT